MRRSAMHERAAANDGVSHNCSLCRARRETSRPPRARRPHRLRGRFSAGLMADAVLASQEQHADRHTGGENHRIVPGAARHAVRRAPGLLDGTVEHGGDGRVHGDGWLIQARLTRHRPDRAAVRSPRLPVVSAFVPPVRVTSTGCLTSSDTTRAPERRCRRPARRRSSRPWQPARKSPAPRARLRRSMPRRHASASLRSFIGVVPAWAAAPRERDVRAGSARKSTSTTAKRKVEVLEHRTLLDVELEIPERARRQPSRRECDSDRDRSRGWRRARFVPASSDAIEQAPCRTCRPARGCRETARRSARPLRPKIRRLRWQTANAVRRAARRARPQA